MTADLAAELEEGCYAVSSNSSSISMKNKIKRRNWDETRAHLLGNLSRLKNAPSVLFQERPPDTEFQEANHVDDGNGRWDSDDVDADSGPKC
ncbi:hypothetical protein WN943_007183 [Citrus x changshan-huyou]